MRDEASWFKPTITEASAIRRIMMEMRLSAVGNGASTTTGRAGGPCQDTQVRWMGQGPSNKILTRGSASMMAVAAVILQQRLCGRLCGTPSRAKVFEDIWIRS
ncbi:hypothetical protein PENSPDRAFT_262887 [Peniophora sp. CONT]|nr:hypothetical protein PENSPDRAFT_262887 [Peniophora sp. CONT]